MIHGQFFGMSYCQATLSLGRVGMKCVEVILTEKFVFHKRQNSPTIIPTQLNMFHSDDPQDNILPYLILFRFNIL